MNDTSRPPRKTLGLWHHPNFLKLWLAQSVSQTGSAVTMVALPLICVTHLHATPQQMGLLVAAEVAPLLLLRLPAAAWADASLRRIPMMVGASLFSAFFVGLIPFAWVLGILHFPLILAIGLLLSSVSAVGGMFAAPVLPSLVERSDLVEANGKLSMTRGIAEVSGRGLAGLLIGAVGAPLAMVVDAASFLFSAAMTFRIQLPPAEAPVIVEPGGYRVLFRGFALLVERPILGMFVGLTGCLSAVNGVVSALLVLYMSQELSLSAAVIGIVFGAGSAGAILSGPLVAVFHRRLGARGTMTLAVVLLTWSFALLPFANGSTPGWFGLVACLNYDIVGSFAAPLLIITIFSEVPNQVPSHTIARAIATISIVPEGAMMLGALAGGVLGASLGITRSFAVCLGLAVFSTVVLLFLLRRIGSKRLSMSGPDASI